MPGPSVWRVALSRVARSPLAHFAVLGGAIFALAPRQGDPRAVDVPRTALVTLEHAQAARELATSLSPDEAREVDARAIEDEVLYREAVRLGLDRDDPIIRQRLVQKLLLLVEDLGGASRAPTDEELRAFFDEDPGRYRLPARVHLVHVFASRQDHLPAPGALPLSGVPRAGEAFPYPRELTASKEELARVYGDGFATAAFERRPEEGFGAPVASSFGWHLLHVIDRAPGRIPSFEEARRGLLLDYALKKREDVVADYLKKTVSSYRVAIDGQPLKNFSPTRRVAIRSDPSAED